MPLFTVAEQEALAGHQVVVLGPRAALTVEMKARAEGMLGVRAIRRVAGQEKIEFCSTGSITVASLGGAELRGRSVDRLVCTLADVADARLAGVLPVLYARPGARLIAVGRGEPR